VRLSGSVLPVCLPAAGARRALAFLVPCAPYVLAALGLMPVLADAHKSNRAPIVTVPYTTAAGDTLYEIAARFLRDPHDWAVLSRLNNVPAPRHLRAGIQIKLPAALLREDRESARVLATSGPVERAFGTGPYTPLARGMMLGEGDRVRTGHEGFATLELADGSHVSISQDGMVEIGKLRQTVLTGASDRVIDLRHGEVDSEVTHATKKDDRFQIRSPSVVAGVRGTRFRVNYDAGQQQTAVEVLDGAVGVDPGGAPAPAPGVPLQASEQLVSAHFGNVSGASGAIGAPIQLLPAPALNDPGKIQDGKTVAFDLVPDSHAAGYRVQIARDADLLDLIRDLPMSAPQVDFGDLRDGTYFVRISAIDHNGLEGLPQTYGFERRQLGLTASATPRPGTRDYTFRWFASRPGVETRFRFVLAATPDLRNPILDRPDGPAARRLLLDRDRRAVRKRPVLPEGQLDPVVHACPLGL